MDLEKGSDANTDLWIWGAILLSWLLFVARYLMLVVAPPIKETPKKYDVDLELWAQCFSMAQFAMERGKTPDAHDLATIQRYAGITWDRYNLKRMTELTEAHKHLSRLVSPALPKTIVLLSKFNLDIEEKTSKKKTEESFTWLGNVQVARMMLGLALALLPVFIGLALYKGTSLNSPTDLVQGGFLDKAATATYLIVASALGASFAALFKVRKYVERLNYDDQYESSYWVRFILGMVAGLLLSVLLSTLLPTSDDTQEFRITLPILALIGGFSSDLVYRILKRLIDAVETLIEGSASEVNEAEKQRSEARLREQEAEAKQHLDDELREGRQKEMATLIAMLGHLPEGEAGTPARDKISERLAELVRPTSDDGAGDAAAETAAAAEDGDDSGGGESPPNPIQ